MSWQDLAFTAGSVLFSIALLPAVARQDPPPWATCAMTAAVLDVFAVCYTSLGFWFSAASTFVTATLWAVLLVQALEKEKA